MNTPIVRLLNELSTLFFSLKMTKEGDWVNEKKREFQALLPDEKNAFLLIKQVEGALIGMGSLTDVPPSIFREQPDGTEEKLHDLINRIGTEIELLSR